MFKYSFYFILTITILSLSKVFATQEPFVEDKSFSHIHNLTLITLYDDAIGHIASYLDPLSLTRLLRTNKSLGVRIRTKGQNADDSIKPIPFGEKLLLQEINQFKAVESYIFIICQRLPYSFKSFRSMLEPIMQNSSNIISQYVFDSVNSFLGPYSTWHNFPTVLQKQKDEIKSLWDKEYSPSKYDAAYTLRRLYRSIRSQQVQNNPNCLKLYEKIQSFLKDMPERHEAITNMRPLVLSGYLTEVLYYHSKLFFPRMKYDQDLSFLDIVS